MTPEQRMHDIIVGRMAQLELDHGVEIIFAVESGSRAWGFASPDSDWDVRYVYRRPPAEYIRLNKQPDTMGRSVKGALYDAHGWDVGKALRLALASNATLLEWMRSPVVYRWERPAADELKAACDRLANPRALTWHHYNLTRTAAEQVREARAAGQPVKLKKYLYGLRSALSLRHVRMFPGVPPMNIQQLIEATDLSPKQEQALGWVIAKKSSEGEDGTYGACDELDSLMFTEELMAADTKPEKGQLTDDAKLLELTERVFLKLIGVELPRVAAGTARL